MAGTTGLEPATSAVTGQRSNQLSYVPRLFFNEPSRWGHYGRQTEPYQRRALVYQMGGPWPTLEHPFCSPQTWSVRKSFITSSPITRPSRVDQSQRLLIPCLSNAYVCFLLLFRQFLSSPLTIAD